MSRDTSLTEKNNFACSVITVSFNNALELERTILSVINQNYKNFEFIIIDGGSTDNSIEIIKKYKDSISFWLSEQDDGIYDAMNKGANIAKGSWLNFMNAGDVYVNNNVLMDVFNIKHLDRYSLLLGNTIIKYEGMTRRFEGSINKMKYGTQFVHQSTFISKDYQMMNLYDVEQEIAADYKFFYKAINDGEKYLELKKDICLFSSGGISDTQRIKSLFAGLIISISISFNFAAIVVYVNNIFKSILKLVVKSIIPKKIIDKIRIILHKD